ncbi:MAG: cobalamin-dependent protein [Deltaproteobacteria bacterium]|jgi:methanogenic corrinoid protein MtbC1|nr:cobalamin-dependent protein [Deltaproteobacteria bacterium]
MNDLSLALRDLDEKRVYELVEKQLAAGASAIDIINACNEGMVAAGELFSQGTYFISELIFSAEILKEIMKRIEPLMQTAPAGACRGKVVIGTVKGDIHDIGKNIVVTLLRGSGFEVTDLGVDVPAEKFVEALERSGAKVLGMSALLNFTYPEMKNVVEAVASAGLRDKVRIIIGGAPVNEQVREFAGADFAAKDAVAGVEFCRNIYG